MVAVKRTTYEVIAKRDGGSWLLRVPAVDRSTQALRLDQAEEMARDLISIMTGLPPESFEIEITTKLDPELSGLLAQVARAKAEAVEHQQQASRLQRQAVRVLTDSGLTVRDTGRLLGLTHQRVAQLRSEQRSTDG